MVLKDNIGFQSGSFTWHAFQMVQGQVATHTTGSDDVIPVLLCDSEHSWNSYGCPPQGKVGDCPKCQGYSGLSTGPLHMNPLARMWFFICPLCGRTFRYLSSDETLSDLKQIKPSSLKKTPLDENENILSFISY